MIDLYDYSRSQLAALLASWGFSPVHAAPLWRALYRHCVVAINNLPELPAQLRTRLAQEATLGCSTTVAHHVASDGLAHKYLLGLRDGERIETVLMHYRSRATACVSTQAGCALGCVFCATGQQGFRRNLTSGEIVAQAMHVQRALRKFAAPGEPSQLQNLVLMGMGEPLLNYDAVMHALDILRDPGGLAIGVKQITLSTVGVVPGILRMANERRPYSLAVSLHAASQEERAAMLPAGRTWPLDELLEACRYYIGQTQRKIFFEWTLIAGQNDSPQQAHQLGQLLQGMQAQVNLIPLNPTVGYDSAPPPAEATAEFQSILRQYGLPATVRQRRGIDIAAGCGQLAGADLAGPRAKL
jgi:23S rRNA (adenine2503-C2)-methyltransferase